MLLQTEGSFSCPRAREPSSLPHHDLGNISIGADGKGTLTLLSKEWTVQPGPKSVVGHALVFHIRQDDGTSQPVGDAGTRPGCGVIGTTPPAACLDDTLVGGRKALYDCINNAGNGLTCTTCMDFVKGKN